MPSASATIAAFRVSPIGLADVVASVGRPRTYAPTAGRVDRVSLAWWREGPDDATPLVLPRAGQLVTLITVWRTDARGQLLAGGLDEAIVHVWPLAPAAAEALAEIHARWHLGRHDLLVRGPVDAAHPNDVLLVPCRDSVPRRLEIAGTPGAEVVLQRLAHEVAEAVRALGCGPTLVG